VHGDCTTHERRVSYANESSAREALAQGIGVRMMCQRAGKIGISLLGSTDEAAEERNDPVEVEAEEASPQWVWRLADVEVDETPPPGAARAALLEARDRARRRCAD